jgi:hypothetical protein
MKAPAADLYEGDARAPRRLLRTPVPHADESLMGYVVRLTEENGYGAPSWIFDLAGLRNGARGGGWTALYSPGFDPTLLERVIGLKRPEFDALRYGIGSSRRSVIFADQPISIDFIRFSTPKLCPLCLREASYYKRFWDLLPLTACAVHGLILIDTCSDCGRRVSWLRKKVSVCHCGFDWRTSKPVEASPAGLEVSRQALRLCELSSGITQGEISNSPLYGLGLNDFCLALTLVAGYYLFVKCGRWVMTKTANSICHDAYSQALEAFSDWPVSFYEFLNRTKRSGGRRIAESKIYRRLGMECDIPSLRFMRIACEDYIEEYEWSAPAPGSARPPTFRRFIDEGEACRRLRVNNEWLDLLIERDKLDVVDSPSRPGVLIDAESITNLRGELSLLLSIWQVALILDIDRADAEDLINQGCLKPVSGPTVDGLPDWGVERQEPVDLVRRIEALVVDKPPAPRDNLMTAGSAIHQMKIRGFSAGRFVRAILEGEITPQAVLPRYRGLSSFAFPKDCVLKFVRTHAPAKSRCVKGFRDVAKSLERMKEQNDRMFTSYKKEIYVPCGRGLIDMAGYVRSIDRSHVSELIGGISMTWRESPGKCLVGQSCRTSANGNYVTFGRANAAGQWRGRAAFCRFHYLSRGGSRKPKSSAPLVTTQPLVLKLAPLLFKLIHKSA